MDQAELTRMDRMIDSEMKLRFPAGAVRRATVLQPGDDPEELLIRVFVAVPDGPQNPRQSLEAWAQAQEAAMKRVRRELSLRIPEAKLLEFTVEDAGDPDAAPRITMPDDPALTSTPLSVREMVETTLALLRRSYVFPDRAEQAATAIEARLAAGEYDDLDETALAERLTAQLGTRSARTSTCGSEPCRRGRSGRPGPSRTGPGRPGLAGAGDTPVPPTSPVTRSTTAFSGSNGWTATSAISTCTR